MKQFVSLIKMQLNVNYGISALKYRFTREKKKLWEPILIAVAIVFGFLPLLVMYTLLMTGIFAAGVTLKQPEIVLTIAFLFAMLIILFFGIFYIMGTFYFSQDLESLVPLPLKPYEVVGGKFAVIIVNEYLTALPVLLPPMIIYGAGTGQGLFYWLKCLLLMLAVPSLPLAIAALIIVVLMRVINFRRYKDLLAVIGGFAALALGIGFSVFMQNAPKFGNDEYIKNLLAGQTDLIGLMGRKFPPSIWATRSLSENGFLGVGYLLLFIAVCLLLLLALLWLSNKVFYQALLAGQEVSKKRKHLSGAQLQKEYGRVSSPVTSLMKREWKLLYRTPIYVLNGLSGSIIGPIILFIMFAVRGSDPDMIKMFSVISQPGVVSYVLLGGLGLMLFTAGMNLVASTALSREGQTFWITKMIPVPARQQVTSKLLVSLIVGAVGVITSGLVLWLLVRLPLLPVVGISIVGMLGAVPMTALNLLLDVFHPKLVWSSEQEAMKQNMNGGLGMLLSIVVLLILGLVALVMMLLHVSMPLVFAAIGLVSVVLGILSILALYAVASRKYQELEA